ncbi:MAG: T9SS type A sorting domain-containing protein [Segetibacter sp.]
MWTESWTNWDPQTAAYAATTVTASGHITANTAWTKNNVYLLSGVVYVDSLVTLTIEPGTVIRGDNAVANSALIVKRGGKLLAEGTACNPIVFTSNLPAGSRNKGDWGGVILLGRARNNQTGGVGYIEGLAASADNAFGGTDDADNSGLLKYVRIEYGGYVFAPNQEINGLTFGSVGAGTTIDYVQVSYSNDDSYEWFGGSVNCSHLVAYRGLDDDFDNDNGFSGKVQFCLGVRDPNISDNPAVSNSEGFESDNDANGSTNMPQTSAVFSNITVIGPYRGDPNATVAPGFRRGARLRRNTGLKIFNSILMDYATGLFIDGPAAFANAANGVLKFKNNIVALAGPAQRVAENDSSRTVFLTAGNNNDSVGTTTGVLTAPYDFLNPDYRPAAGSLALSNYNYSDPAFGMVIMPGSITPVTYRGAFAPAPTPMWTESWTNWDPQTAAYAATTVTASGHITANTAWTKNNVYLLSGVVYVDSLVTLTIEPGTVIRGDNAVANSALIVKRGGKLLAEGTACNPIVFTSNLPAGSRNKGDWGGVILLGRARNNQTGGVGYIEGLAASADNAFGGTDDADNSGLLKYVRIEYGGYVFAPNQEINGLTFGSVGAGTTIDYVQVSYSNDDSYEWFGGSVNCSHLVAYRGLDDDFDNDNGFSGKVQFCLGVRDPNISDNPAVSNSEGFESDNDANGSTNMPQTSAVFSNITVIGPYRGDPNATVAPGFRRGARLRRNTGLKIFNSILMDYATGLFIDGPAAFANAANGVLKFKNNIVALAGPAQRVAENDSSRTVFLTAGNNNDSVGTTTGVLTAPYDFLNPDYRPAAGSLALSNYSFTDQALPVTLVKFSGQTVNNQHVLSWETATEINNRGFELERSLNGRNFSSIGFIPSKALNGNSTLALQYSFTDVKVPDGKLYYRLNQLDKDGKSTLSSILVLSKLTSSLSVASIYPNPVRDQLSLAVVSPSMQRVTVRISDAFGKIIYQRVLGVSAGSNVYNMNIKSLSSGNYFVNFITDKGNQSPVVKSFLKQ